MNRPARQPRFDADAYLEWEAGQAEKHEYLDGEVFAMSGASDAHVTIAGNLFLALHRHLGGSPCRVFFSDMKLEVAEDNAFFYPDVFVTCTESDRAQRHYKSDPSLIVEVLSPSTSAYDRGAKFAAYRKLPSLREYALIDSERLSLDLFRRDDAGRWVLYPFDAANPQVEFASVGLALPLQSLYDDVALEPTPAHP
ncbi:MAG: Uma2 family endonuclease [Acidovorax sp.]